MTRDCAGRAAASRRPPRATRVAEAAHDHAQTPRQGRQVKRALVTFECSRCGAMLPDADALKAHALRHARYDLHDGRPAPVRPAVTFACAHCGAGFQTSAGLRGHALEHGEILAETPALVGDTGRPAALREAPPEPPVALPPDVLRPAPLAERRMARHARRAHSMTKAVAMLAATIVLLVLGAATALAGSPARRRGRPASPPAPGGAT